MTIPDFQVSYLNEAQITQIFGRGLTPEMAMVEIQVLMTKDFNDQAQAIAEEIQFLDDIKNKYRDQIQVFHRFLGKNHNTSREDGKVYIEATAGEIAQLMRSTTTYNPTYNAKTGEGLENAHGINISNDGENSELSELDIPNPNEVSDSLDLAAYFEDIENTVDPDEKKQKAERLGGDDNNLFAYFGASNNKTKSGEPKFGVYLNSVENMLKQVEAESSKLDTKIESLNNTLSTLLKHRETAINSLQSTITQLSQIRENSIKKV